MTRIASSKVHFIGIGGSGMSGLAELIHNMGARVTGSDALENSQVDKLRSMGIKVFIGHDPSYLEEDVDVVVYSSAIRFSNVEIQEAKKRGVPIIPRVEVLSEVMRLKRGIAVGGTHGKTTTTSMIASIFIHAQLDPTVVVGGRLDLIKSHSFLGKGEWLIAESDESDGSFLKLSPEIAVITNIDNDHLDYYGNFEALKKAFFDFARLVPFYGLTVAWGDSSEVRHALSGYNKKIIYYGFDEHNDYILKKLNENYVVAKEGQILAKLELPVPGKHNALNATAAVIVGLQAGIPLDRCIAGLKAFGGVDRRFHFRGTKNEIQFYDDYGHHPTEIAATLQAFREKFPKAKLVVAFQPHRYSRTQLCWDGFKTAFADASEVLLWDIYAAGEDPIAGLDSKVLTADIQHPNVFYVGSGEQIGRAHV